MSKRASFQQQSRAVAPIAALPLLGFQVLNWVATLSTMPEDLRQFWEAHMAELSPYAWVFLAVIGLVLGWAYWPSLRGRFGVQDDPSPEEGIGGGVTQTIHGPSSANIGVIHGPVTIGPPPGGPNHLIANTLFSERLALYKKIDAFICQKDEVALRELFDLNTMLEWNVRNVAFNRGVAATDADKKELDRLMEGAGSTIDRNDVEMELVNNAWRIKHSKPGVLWAHVNFSQKYASATDKLNAWQANALLPNDVRAALGEILQALHDNKMLILRIIQKGLTEKPEALLHSFVEGHEYQNWICNPYTHQATALQPLARKLGRTIEGALTQ